MESRAQRLHIVLVLFERKEQQAAQKLQDYRSQLEQERAQLKQLDDYAEHYLQAYAQRKHAIRPQEFISYSSFIQRLGDLRKDQQQKLDRMLPLEVKLQEEWRNSHQKTKSMQDLIERLKNEEHLAHDKQFQKVLDDLVTQAYARQSTDE